MPTSRLVQIRLTLEDLASKTLKKTESSFGAFGKSLEKNSKDFKKFGTGITAVGVGLGGLLVKTGLTAARVEVLGTVMENIGRVSGVSNNILAEQEETIKKLGITTRASRELLIKFMQSQLDVSDASKIARVAQDLAVISGQNSSEAAETLTNAIVTQNTVLLKQFGIVQNLNKIYDGYAEELGKSSDELTDVEKKQAFLNVILKEGEKVAGTYDAAMGDVGKQMSSLARLIETAEEKFGEAFLPVMEKVIESITKLLKAYIALSPEQKKLITQVTIATAAFSLILGPLLLLIGFLPAIAAGFAILTGPVGWVILAITALTAVITALYLNWDKVQRFFKETWLGLKIIISETIDSLMIKIQPFINAWEKVKGGAKWFGGQIGKGINLLGFEKGGIVPGAVGQPVPAIVHGGETIIPAGASIGGGMTININGGTYLDRDSGRKIAEQISQYLRFNQRL